MNTIYFLAAVAACAIVLVVLVMRSTRDRRDHAVRTNRPAQPLYRRQMAGHSVLHSHAGHLPSEQTADPWHAQRRHAQKDHWDASRQDSVPGQFTASRLRSDEELEKGSEDDEMTMGEIHYTPTDFTRAAGRKR